MLHKVLHRIPTLLPKDSNTGYRPAIYEAGGERELFLFSITGLVLTISVCHFLEPSEIHKFTRVRMLRRIA